MASPGTYGGALGNAAKRLYASHQAAQDASDRVAQERTQEAEQKTQEQPPKDGQGEGR